MKQRGKDKSGGKGKGVGGKRERKDKAREIKRKK